MQTSHQDETTNDEILHAVKDFAEHVQSQFDDVHEQLTGINGRLTKVEATMVTKDYLDEKLFDLKGDLVILVRKEDAFLAPDPFPTLPRFIFQHNRRRRRA